MQERNIGQKTKTKKKKQRHNKKTQEREKDKANIHKLTKGKILVLCIYLNFIVYHKTFSFNLFQNKNHSVLMSNFHIIESWIYFVLLYL